MGILGIGIDILHLPRLKLALSRRPDRFLTRILTKAELTDFEQLKTELHGEVAHDRAVRFIGVRYASFVPLLVGTLLSLLLHQFLTGIERRPIYINAYNSTLCFG